MGLIFLIWLLVAAVNDALSRKCFNWIVISGALSAVFSLLMFPDSHPVSIGLLDSFFGAVAAFLVLLVFYRMKMMGAGDVKYALVLGLWVGWKLLLPIWGLSCIFAMAHGLVVRSNLKYFYAPALNWDDGTKKNNRRFIPYVTYLSMAAVIVLMLNK